MGIKSRGGWSMGACIPKKEKCLKCIYLDECKEINVRPTTSEVSEVRKAVSRV